MEWYKNPTILIVGGVALVAGFILLRNQNTSSATPQVGTSSNPQLSNLQTSGTTPVGQSYSYLDGSGIEHMVATDPYGNLTSYQTTSADASTADYSGQLSSYVGMMGSQPMFLNPYGGTTPYYSQVPTQPSTY
jgi:hypothetical protein